MKARKTTVTTIELMKLFKQDLPEPVAIGMVRAIADVADEMIDMPIQLAIIVGKKGSELAKSAKIEKEAPNDSRPPSLLPKSQSRKTS